MWYLLNADGQLDGGVTAPEYDPRHSAAAGLYVGITQFILYGYLIPISLYVSMEMVKVAQARATSGLPAFRPADVPAFKPFGLPAFFQKKSNTEKRQKGGNKQKGAKTKKRLPRGNQLSTAPPSAVDVLHQLRPQDVPRRDRHARGCPHLQP